MSLFGLSLAYIRARALNAALNLVLLALGVGMIVLLLLFSAQLESRLTRDARSRAASSTNASCSPLGRQAARSACPRVPPRWSRWCARSRWNLPKAPS
jgi:hypothetical protein